MKISYGILGIHQGVEVTVTFDLQNLVTSFLSPSVSLII